jgi:hypothetical protein
MTYHDAGTEDIPDALWLEDGGMVHVSLSRHEAQAFLAAHRSNVESPPGLLAADMAVRDAIRQTWPELDH